MIVTCGCDAPAVYAVYEDRQPLCLKCMLAAVDTPIAIPVRTLDPWETNPPKTNNAPGCNQER